MIVAYGRVPSIIVTLATLAIYRVVIIEVAEAGTITTRGFPDWLVDLAGVNLVTIGDLDIRVVFALTLVVVAIGQLVLTFLPYGRRLYAIGSNPDAARTAGLPMQRDVFLAFVGCGALAGLAGFVFLARFGNVSAIAAAGLELEVVAAVVVGGVNIFGGSGSMIGAFLGVVLIAVLEQSLTRWIGSVTSCATSCWASSSSRRSRATRSSSGASRTPGCASVGAMTQPAGSPGRARRSMAGSDRDATSIPGTGSCSRSSSSSSS